MFGSHFAEPTELYTFVPRMAVTKLTIKQKQLIEKLGIVYEGFGMPPVAARIISLLVVSDVTELTFDDIREILNASKSAVSNALNLLQSRRMVEYITRPGERKRYFRSNLINLENTMEERFKTLLVMKEFYREVLEQRPKSTPEFNRALKNVIAFMEFMQGEHVTLFEKWKKIKK